MRRWLNWMVLFTLAVEVPVAARAAPVALVTGLAGTGSIAGKDLRAGPLELLHDLAAGTRITLAPGARATIVHTASGAVYALSGPGVFRVAPGSIDTADPRARLAKRELPAALRAYKLDPSVAAQASLVLRGVDMPRLDGPDGGVLTEQELRYRLPGDLRGVRMQVLDARDTLVVDLDSVQDSVDLAGRHVWRPGERYRVKLAGTARNGRAATATAQFAIVASGEVERIVALRPQGTPTRTDWIVYALALESIGADATARPIWRSLAASR